MWALPWVYLESRFGDLLSDWVMFFLTQVLFVLRMLGMEVPVSPNAARRRWMNITRHCD
jgi:hypothetical protein